MTNVRTKPTPQAVFNLFVTALEGGIGYWSVTRAYRPWKPRAGVLAPYVENPEGFYAEIEDEDGKRHCIDATVIQRGLDRLQACHVTWGGAAWSPARQLDVWGRCVAEDGSYDAGDADLVVQAGLFGDVVYG